jgi:hypothetical protein
VTGAREVEVDLHRCRWSPATLCSAVATVGGAQWQPAAAELPVAHSSP